MGGSVEVDERLLRAKAAFLRRWLEQVRAEVVELKHELHEEVDARRREQEVQGELDAAQEGQRNLEALCCYGAPDWEEGTDASSDGVWGPWLEGIEVVYRAASAWQNGSNTSPSCTASTSRRADTGSSSSSSAGSHGGTLRVVQASRPVRLRIYKQPFAMGGVRLAKYARSGWGL